jgi:hypothetical protein
MPREVGLRTDSRWEWSLLQKCPTICRLFFIFWPLKQKIKKYKQEYAQVAFKLTAQQLAKIAEQTRIFCHAPLAACESVESSLKYISTAPLIPNRIAITLGAKVGDDFGPKVKVTPGRDKRKQLYIFFYYWPLSSG